MADQPPTEVGDPIATTTHGRVRGAVQGRTLAFRGIPYAAPTGGAHRFLPPQPLEPWTGVRDAREPGARCPQVKALRAPEFDWLHVEQPMSEDCLALNVHTPALDGARRPVLVWLHGGAFAFGTKDSPVYDGGELAARGDVVVVGVNHRLNVLGYLPPVLQGERFASSGNAGMLDIVTALHWVRDNIAAFGGDPGCVTLFGQSGGGAKVVILSAMAEAQGLFHRAIVQSPSSGFRVQTAEDGARQGERLLHELGLTRSDGAALQQLPEAALRVAMARVVAAEGGDDHFRPVIDGRHLLRHPYEPEAPAGAAAIPMLIGCTATETTFYLQGDPTRARIDDAELRRRVARFLKIDDGAAAALVQGYAAHHPGATPGDLLVHISSDHMYRLNTVEGAEAKARQRGAPVYLYRFAWNSPAQRGWLRAPHTAELPFVFGQVALARAFTGDTPDARALERQMLDAWVRFARTGNPNGEGLPSWPALQGAGRPTMVFDAAGEATTSRVEADPAGADLALMAALRRYVPGNAATFRAA